MARSIRHLGVVALVCLIDVLGYFSRVGYSAREYTVNTFLPHYRETSYPLAVTDLSPRQIEILLKVEAPRFFQHNGVDRIFLQPC